MTPCRKAKRPHLSPLVLIGRLLIGAVKTAGLFSFLAQMTHSGQALCQNHVVLSGLFFFFPLSLEALCFHTKCISTTTATQTEQRLLGYRRRAEYFTPKASKSKVVCSLTADTSLQRWFWRPRADFVEPDNTSVLKCDWIKNSPAIFDNGSSATEKIEDNVT